MQRRPAIGSSQDKKNQGEEEKEKELFLPYQVQMQQYRVNISVGRSARRVTKGTHAQKAEVVRSPRLPTRTSLFSPSLQASLNTTHGSSTANSSMTVVLSPVF